jgi:hypothetical protein
MSTVKYLSQEELVELKGISERYNKIVIGLGEITLVINELENRVSNLKNEKEHIFTDHVKLIEDQTALQNKLLEKYGEGTIDLTTGKIETVQ